MIGWFFSPILFAPKMQNANYSGMANAGGLRWKVSPADDEDGSASSISDVFADMLNVNEDMIVAAAESQAEGDVDGLIAYQRILHRDLMEMAEFIDSMFGVYSNADNSSSCRTTTTTKKSEEVEAPVVVDLTVETTDRQATAEQADLVKEKPPATKKEQRGALLTAIEAGEKVREIQRSKEQWIKSRHQVLEEEGVSAIMNDNSNGMLEVATAKPGEKETQQGSGGIALANQLRAHQHIAAFLQASKENAATTAAPPTTPMDLLLASQLALSAAAPALTLPASIPPAPMTTATTGQQIKPSSVGSNPKIALPPAHSMFNMLFAFPGGPPLMLNPPALGGVMPMQWQPQLQTPLPVRSVVPARPPVKAPEFKRMCESCRKRHFSVRQCRLVLQHTDPEWQPAEQPPTVRRRRRKQPVANTTKQVT